MPFREDEDEYQQPPPHGWILNPDGSLGGTKATNKKWLEQQILVVPTEVAGGPYVLFLKPKWISTK